MLFDVARSLAITYPDEVDDSVSQLAATAVEKNDNEESGTNEATPVLTKIMEIFSGTRHCPVDDSGTTLFLALKHPSPAVRISGIKSLAARDREIGDGALSFESATEARFVFDAVFTIIAGDDEEAVVSQAACYAEKSALWAKVYASAAKGTERNGQDLGLADFAVTATCKALHRWSGNSTTETPKEIKTLVEHLLGVAEALLSWLAKSTNDGIEDQNVPTPRQAGVGRPLYRIITALLPTPLGVRNDGSDAAVTPIGAKAAHVQQLQDVHLFYCLSWV